MSTLTIKTPMWSQAIGKKSLWSPFVGKKKKLHVLERLQFAKEHIGLKKKEVEIHQNTWKGHVALCWRRSDLEMGVSTRQPKHTRKQQHLGSRPTRSMLSSGQPNWWTLIQSNGPFPLVPTLCGSTHVDSTRSQWLFHCSSVPPRCGWGLHGKAARNAVMCFICGNSGHVCDHNNGGRSSFSEGDQANCR